MKFMSQYLAVICDHIHKLISQYWLSKILYDMFHQNIQIITTELCLNNTRKTLTHSFKIQYNLFKFKKEKLLNFFSIICV